MEETRNSGIDVIGPVSWGFHMCLFYKTRNDLIEVFTPYIKAGLESNESCVLITSGKIDSKRIKKILRAAIPGLDECLKNGRIEIIDFAKWYFRNGKFDMQASFDNAADRLKKSLGAKHSGLRIFTEGGTFDKTKWKDLFVYEQSVQKNISGRQIMAVCAYPLAKCRTKQLIDMICSHKFALLRDYGEWKVVKCFEGSKIEEETGSMMDIAPVLAGTGKTGDFKKIIRTKIRAERKKRGLTQDEFARKAGVSLNFLGQIERGTRTPSLGKLIKISEAIDTDFKNFFSSVQSAPPEKDKFTEKIMSVLDTSSSEEKKLFYQVINFLSRKFESGGDTDEDD